MTHRRVDRAVPRRRNPYSGLVLLVVACGLAGCDGIIGVACTSELRPSLIVEVRDAVTGEPAARGTTGSAEHPGSGTYTELFATDSVTLRGNWGRERSGQYFLTIVKPGYATEQTSVTVDEDQCHVQTERVEVELSTDPNATLVEPLSLERGEHVDGHPASAGVLVLGDTLVISGRAAAPCSDLDVVAFRVGQSWHVQLQPEEWGLRCPGSPGLQQFEARFGLDAGTTQLLVTHGHGPPAELFSGAVATQ